jgi:hypothetical protein
MWYYEERIDIYLMGKKNPPQKNSLWHIPLIFLAVIVGLCLIFKFAIKDPIDESSRNRIYPYTSKPSPVPTAPVKPSPFPRESAGPAPQ